MNFTASPSPLDQIAALGYILFWLLILPSAFGCASFAILGRVVHALLFETLLHVRIQLRRRAQIQEHFVNGDVLEDQSSASAFVYGCYAAGLFSNEVLHRWL